MMRAVSLAVSPVMLAVCSPVVLVILTGYFCTAQGQPRANVTRNVSNSSNSTNQTIVCPDPVPYCSKEIRSEVYLACMELRTFGLTNQRCAIWQDSAQAVCESTCGSCPQIGRAVYDQCMFAIQFSTVYQMAVSYCQGVQYSFVQVRCPSAIIDKVRCLGLPTYKTCQVSCGNFQTCGCSRQWGTPGALDICIGQTVLPDKDGDLGDCSLIPQDCKNSWIGTTCGIFAHCPVDMCILRNVTCPAKDTCQTAGACDPTNGACFYKTLPDGSSCNDGKDYTYDDVCLDAKCVGKEDKCLRYNIVCQSSNPCLVATPLVRNACDPQTGICVFDARPDGTRCPTRPNGPWDGECQAGLCRLVQHDRCWGVVCKSDNYCFSEPTCNPHTGKCESHPLPEGSSCSDGDNSTARDMCIDGKCIGDPIATPSFLQVGTSGCEGESEISASTRVYFGDVLEIPECQQQCILDPGCIAFSYGYHICKIYGGSRTRDPDKLYWGHSWALADPLAKVTKTYSMVCYLKKDDAVAVQVASKIKLFGLTVTVLLVVPLVWAGVFFGRAVFHSFRKVTGCCSHRDRIHGKELDHSNLAHHTGADLPSPKGESCIAAAPTEVEGEGTEEEHPTDPRGEIRDKEGIQDTGIAQGCSPVQAS